MENKFYSVLEFDETEEGGGSFGYFGLMCDGEPTRILVRFNGSADRHGAMDVALELCDRWNGFEAHQDNPQPVEEIEGLEEAITMSASSCYMNGVRAYYDTTWIEALVEASRRYLALTADNAKRGSE